MYALEKIQAIPLHRVGSEKPSKWTEHFTESIDLKFLSQIDQVSKQFLIS